MKSRTSVRTISFKLTWDETKPGAREYVTKMLNEIMADREFPLPFVVSGGHAEFGSYQIERIWR